MCGGGGGRERERVVSSPDPIYIRQQAGRLYRRSAACIGSGDETRRCRGMGHTLGSSLVLGG